MIEAKLDHDDKIILFFLIIVAEILTIGVTIIHVIPGLIFAIFVTNVLYMAALLTCELAIYKTFLTGD